MLRSRGDGNALLPRRRATPDPACVSVGQWEHSRERRTQGSLEQGNHVVPRPGDEEADEAHAEAEAGALAEEPHPPKQVACEDVLRLRVQPRYACLSMMSSDVFGLCAWHVVFKRRKY